MNFKEEQVVNMLALVAAYAASEKDTDLTTKELRTLAQQTLAQAADVLGIVVLRREDGHLGITKAARPS